MMTAAVSRGSWRDEFFTCEICRNTYRKARSDEDALDESAEVFGYLPTEEERAVICDDCERAVIAWGKSLPFGHPFRLDPRA